VPDHDRIPPADLTRVAVENPYEIRRWCQRFVCTETQLRRAVQKVGNDPGAVRAELQRQSR
jgi:hypothetical protein